jgi:DNA-directed RNA polymerase subunit M/transcription elongation factor TFIIS
MINCKKCNFIVNGNLSFAIRQNFCPSCGSPLLENKDLKEISGISNKLVINNIASKLDDSERFLLSLFIMENFMKKEEVVASKETSNEEDVEVIESLEDIREEVEREALSLSDSQHLDEDLDEKVQRLKKIHQAAPSLNKKGAAVRRLSGV